jgi:hypothetical protein
MTVKYTLSFNHWLDARDEFMQSRLSTPILFDGALAAVTVVVSVFLMAWSLVSALVIGLLVIVIFGGIAARRLWQVNRIKAKMATLRSDYEKFHSGSYTFEADESGWRLTSINECQQHFWDEVQMFKNSPKTLYLMTHCGACTLPKEAFTAEQLHQLVSWCGVEKEEDF